MRVRKSILLLRMIAVTDKALFKTIEKRVQSELKNNPEVFTGIISLKKKPSITAEQKEMARIRKKRRKGK